MKLKMSEGEKLSLLQTIILMQVLRDKGIITNKELNFINETAKLALMQKEYQEFQEDLK